MVTIDSLRDAGFSISSLKDQSAITLAENDVKFAYFPATETFEDENAVALLHALVYSLLLRRKIVATRYGSQIKNAQYSTTADEQETTKEIRSYCMARLEAYQTVSNFEFRDIIRIYDNLISIDDEELKEAKNRFKSCY